MGFLELSARLLFQFYSFAFLSCLKRSCSRRGQHSRTRGKSEGPCLRGCWRPWALVGTHGQHCLPRPPSPTPSGLPCCPLQAGRGGTPMSDCSGPFGPHTA